ncbi:MAG: ABC transporter ATP-binding protein [Chloroflexota bacterium]|nr:ABC transporter ATP-binding protein [Chloroflexota bacterium]
MAILEVEHICKSFGDGFSLREVSLTAKRGEIVGLLGPSGCGKTTLLRLVAGLEQPDSGSISFDGNLVHGLPPKDRGFGLMFQDLALFPHMDVIGNISFGLRMLHLSKVEINQRVDYLLNLVDLKGYGRRKIHQLSGGERQRVALARSLAPEPRLLMFDEPFGSLDRGLRESLQIEVRSILKKVDVTSIYVTHDRDEAFAMSDSIVIMDKGSIVQAGTPEELFRSPRNELVAWSLGLKNVMMGTLTSSGEIDTPIGPLRGKGTGPSSSGDTPVLVLIDERKLYIGPTINPSSEHQTVMEGVIDNIQFHGGESNILCSVFNGKVTCLVRPGDTDVSFQVGDSVSLVVPAEAIRWVPASE